MKTKRRCIVCSCNFDIDTDRNPYRHVCDCCLIDAGFRICVICGGSKHNDYNTICGICEHTLAYKDKPKASRALLPAGHPLYEFSCKYEGGEVEVAGLPRSEYNKKSYQQTREEKLKKRREFYQQNKEKNKEKRRAYYEKNKEKLIAKNKKYREANRERCNAKQRRWYVENKEKAKESVKRSRERRKERLLAEGSNAEDKR